MGISILQTVLTAVITIASAAVLRPLSLPLKLVPNPTLPPQPSLATLTPSLLQIPKTTTTNLTRPFSILPDEKFRVKINTGAFFLPVDSALINALYFMSIVACQDFTQKLQPRTYSTPSYRNVKITNFAWTEPRFLLWGVYEAIDYMVRFARFYDAELELYWEGNVVGRMKIASVNRASSSSVGGVMTQDLVPAQSNLTTGEEKATGSKSVVAGNLSGSHLAPLALNAPAGLANLPETTIEFVDIMGSKAVKRNDVFLTFYAAFLHVAQFPVGSKMQDFESDSPDKVLSLHMQEIGSGCSYMVVTSALLFVPKYMMEHKEDFGYRETEFVIIVDGRKVCVGTVIRGLVEAERRSLAG